jgi:hypothetical protein
MGTKLVLWQWGRNICWRFLRTGFWGEYFDRWVLRLEKLHDEKLHNLYSSPSIIRMMESGRMKYVRDVGPSGENIPRGKPRRRWVYNIGTCTEWLLKGFGLVTGFIGLSYEPWLHATDHYHTNKCPQSRHFNKGGHMADHQLRFFTSLSQDSGLHAALADPCHVASGPTAQTTSCCYICGQLL